MMQYHVFEIVDRTFRDICADQHQSFGGKLFMFGDDFRQVLPVVTKGGRADEVTTSISRSCFCPYRIVIHLRVNMRLRDTNLCHDDYERL